MTGLIPDSLYMNIALFILASTGVCLTASKLTNYLDVISDRTGMGKAFAGILLLGIATSLPEIVTTGTAASSGSSSLAVSNLMGGVSIQIAVLAMVDLLVLKGKALTSKSPNAALIMQGVILNMTIVLAIAAMASKEIFVFKGVGLWTLIIFATYVLGLFLVHKYEGAPRWRPTEDFKEGGSQKYKEKLQAKYKEVSTMKLSLRFAFMAAGVLVSGYLVTKSAEKLVEQTGTTSNLMGATLLALATSLPEVTTIWTSVKLGAYAMAIGNILGTNTLEVALLFPADIFYRKGPIINETDMNAIFLAALGAILTCIYVWGMMERKDKTFLRMGIDSFLILLIYFSGMMVFGYMQK